MYNSLNDIKNTNSSLSTNLALNKEMATLGTLIDNVFIVRLGEPVRIAGELGASTEENIRLLSSLR